MFMQIRKGYKNRLEQQSQETSVILVMTCTKCHREGAWMCVCAWGVQLDCRCAFVYGQRCMHVPIADSTSVAIRSCKCRGVCVRREWGQSAGERVCAEMCTGEGHVCEEGDVEVCVPRVGVSPCAYISTH